MMAMQTALLRIPLFTVLKRHKLIDSYFHPMEELP
jgi:hypothetical protein